MTIQQPACIGTHYEGRLGCPTCLFESWCKDATESLKPLRITSNIGRNLDSLMAFARETIQALEEIATESEPHTVDRYSHAEHLKIINAKAKAALGLPPGPLRAPDLPPGRRRA